MSDKRNKDANEMTDDELIKSVFPARVVERLRRELHLGERPERENESGDDQSTPKD